MIFRSLSALFVVLMFGIGGCAWFGGGKNDNVTVKQREALEVPPDLARPVGDDLATGPTEGAASFSSYASKPATEGKPSVAAKSSTLESMPKTMVRLERDGASRWLVVQDEPERVWVKAREYFLLNNLKLGVDDAKAGILESEWIERPASIGTGFFGSLLNKIHSTGVRDKIRVRVERGRAAGTTEIYVSYQGLEEVVVSGGGAQVVQTAWQPRPADPEMEAEVLAKIMTHFGLGESQAKTQAASAAAESVPLVKGELILAQDDLDAAWRRIGLALDRSGAIIEDRDRTAGIYYVRYVDSKQSGKRRGSFAWLFGDSDKPAGPDAKGELPIDRFQVRLKALDTGTRVAVFDVKGEPDASSAGQQLLGLLQQQLR